MILTDAEFSRAVPFFSFLHMLNERFGTPSENDTQGKENRPSGSQWNGKAGILKRAQDYIVSASNKYACELSVSFPDETEREEKPFDREAEDQRLESEALKRSTAMDEVE